MRHSAFKGEYSAQVAGSVDSYSLRQPVGVVAGITFNFQPWCQCGCSHGACLRQHVYIKAV